MRTKFIEFINIFIIILNLLLNFILSKKYDKQTFFIDFDIHIDEIEEDKNEF